MARARTIKPHFMRSRSMRAVSGLARLTFIQLWLVADDEGRLAAHPRLLAHLLYPDDREAADRLPGWLDELEDQHCIERYSVDRLEYLRIVNWRRHQKIYHPTPSRLPARPVGARQDSGEPREALGSECETPSDDKTLTPAAQTPEPLATLANRSGKNAQVFERPDSSASFRSDSRGEGFFRRAAAAAQRALGR
jgi:hypothetical protein